MFMILLSTLRVPGAVIISIILTTFCGINYGLMASTIGSSKDGTAITPLGTVGWYTGTQSWLPVMSDIPSGLLRFDKASTPAFWEAVWTFLAVELFDSFGTIVSTVAKAGLDKGTHGNQLVNRAMSVDGFGLMLGAVIGSNSITCYIESLTGIEAGARTGVASIVTGSAFLLSLLFVAPFVLIIPNAATCCALVYVGVVSLAGVRALDFDNAMHLWVGFLTIAIMGFTYSIFNGICFGFIAYSFIQLILAAAEAVSAKFPAVARWLKPREGTDCSLPHPVMAIMSIFFVFRFRYLGA
jgi:AGZA family xanthine/uracil permease-like MFS transporter